MLSIKHSLRLKPVQLSPKQRIGILLLFALIIMAVFMTINLGHNLHYILVRRGYILFTMVIVAFAASIATVLFQSVTHNRILTPSLMGFEALFILIQTIIVFFYNETSSYWLFSIIKFMGESCLLVAFSVLLYRWLFASVNFNINLVLMIGIVLGTLFRSASTLLQRLLDPNEFSILQSRMFATFTKATPELIWFSAVIIFLFGFVLWRKRYVFDVLALGRAQAINLGIDYRRMVTTTLLLISILVAVSTALVGPLTFLGLMVANLAYLMAGSSQHRYLLPTAFLLAVIALVGGQLILEYGLNMAGSLSVVLEFIGGIFFIYLVLKRF
ncbi:iron complex transport system permease protein [Orbus hercynius]|uniref:Iron complex transport system permease protein n=1 Tax=Orbus hercynius TaxID=593135 RepID=A0A495RK02_9GAMM|nr:iron complex transport system permease protein [Orbus hercynius]